MDTKIASIRQMLETADSARGAAQIGAMIIALHALCDVVEAAMATPKPQQPNQSVYDDQHAGRRDAEWQAYQDKHDE
jgi:hypothetical protein